jgi:hypothetical protein
MTKLEALKVRGFEREEKRFLNWKAFFLSFYFSSLLLFNFTSKMISVA